MSVDWFRANVSRFSGSIHFDEPLSRHTYYRIGGPAKLLISPKSLKDLEWIREGLRATGIPHFVVGAGSNLLVSDQGYAGVIIRVNRLNLKIVKTDSEPVSERTLRIHTGASVPVSMLLRRAAQEGWGGLEFLTGVPGSVGGAVFMNAGTHLGETGDRLIHVEYFSLLDPSPMKSASPPDLRFEYRKNLFLPKDALIWAAEWEVTPEEPANVKTRIDETIARRKATQPIDYPSCGSVFKNPKASGKSAWQVVDALGLRGHKIGGAQISEKHSNFIINLGNAKATDVLALIALAKSRAKAELGIELHEEVIYLS